jgi:diadenosine tetraphosphate (Ap4A) HIT family hydrolase
MADIYQDAVLSITTVDPAASLGHLSISSTNPSINTLDKASDDQAKYLFLGASQVAVALFELVKAQGTNIILTETDKALDVQVVARKENDGLDFMWQPKQGNPQEIADVAKKIKDEQKNPNATPPPSTTTKEPTTIKEETTEDGQKKTNYLLKSLRRVPW